MSGNVEWLEFPLLMGFPQIKHAVFLRGQGFDLSEKAGLVHQEIALGIIGSSKGVKLKQRHAADVLALENVTARWTLYDGYDGMITQEKGVALLVRHADCQAALFFDPESGTIANVHCGWRGSIKNIYRETVRKMKDLYGANPRTIRVCISPSLGPTKAEFKHYKKQLPSYFWNYQVTPAHFDFWAISRAQLFEAGCMQKHVVCAGMCTYSSPDECFSYRRDPLTGSHGTMIALNG